ncbi:MAG: glutamate--tRNA ligase [Patescibacteria group bacterium]
MEKIRTRFAPSPTGFLHIGGLRTALYSYALAKHYKGDFLLRIEDTDKKREVVGSKEKIQEALKLFNLNWDEDLVIQSERVKQGLYKKAAEKLIRDGHAFYCQCKAKNAKEEGFSNQLRDPCRDKKLTSGAIKLKVNDNEIISFQDFVVNKKISWNTSTVSDTTLLKSDGFPTYHLAVVVDDSDMHISHVLRGHDWMPSTPIHLLIYKYLNLKVPEIGHLTDILDPDGGKLSKRKGSVAVEKMLQEGYLADAILNFIMLLGWAPKDNKEIFSLDEFVKVFDEKGFQRSNPVFNREKLDWFNGIYLRKLENNKLSEMVFKFLKEKYPKELIIKTIPLVKERINNLSDYWELASFFFEENKEEKKVDESLFGESREKHLKVAFKVINEIDDWNKELLDERLMEEITKNEFKTGDFFMDLRIAITGKKFTPPINDSIFILGKNKSLKRIKNYL